MARTVCLASVLFLAGCASTPTADPIAASDPVEEPSTGLYRLTGGVGNKVVTSLDQIRAGVRPLQSAIDRCYVTTNDEGGWRENLLWDLDVASNGTVTRVTLHPAEYWRGNVIVPGVAAPRLEACMERVLGAMVLPPPVRPGWIRVRFEI